MSKIITLITDFRTTDGYMGAVYGVIKSIDPQADIITVASNIPAADIRKGSRALKNSYQFYPEGTIHVVVVDPTVGPKRRCLLVTDGFYYFIAPDNGVLTPVFKRAKGFTCYQITNEKYRLASESETFHGRDVFAPTAAYLSKGIPAEEFGEKIDDPVMIVDPEPEVVGTEIIGKIVDIDTFGNLVTNIPSSMVCKECTVTIGGFTIVGLSKSYADVPEKQPLAYIGSIGYLEIAVNRGDAANHFGTLVFDEIKVVRPEGQQ